MRAKGSTNAHLYAMSARDQRLHLPVRPDGAVLTTANLPAPQQQRWVVQRKAEIVIGVECGLLSVEEACSRYGLTLDEFLSWKRDRGKGGLAGLHRTRIQDDRPRRPEPRIRMGQR